MNREDLIKLAEECGLLIPTTVEYSHPSHQRLISRLERFAKACIDKHMNEYNLDHYRIE